MSVKTGIPPHVLKRRYTHKESLELFAYYERFPFDDESNFQIPLAHIASILVNQHRDANDQLPIKRFMLFHPDNRASEEDMQQRLDHELAFGNW